MKNFSATAAMLGAAVFAASMMIAPAQAEKRESSIEYHGGKKTYDRRIEKAAIKRAAEKIGELRGSLEGIQDGFIVLETELGAQKSSSLGFPIIREITVDRKTTTGSVPVL